MITAKRRIDRAAKRSLSFIVPKRRQTSVNFEASAFALAAALMSAAFIYELNAMSYGLKLTALVSGVVSAVAYHLIFVLFDSRALDYPLGFDPALLKTERRFSRALSAVVFAARAVTAIFAAFVFGAALLLAPAIAAALGTRPNEALYAAAIGAFFGVGAFVCAIYAFRKPQPNGKNGGARSGGE
ncbi:MAG: hypothetical protein LBC09_02680 [Helicobacteraceae bacterium]|nr:hypothetical protein [Helicobacteraceae bacterium]